MGTTSTFRGKTGKLGNSSKPVSKCLNMKKLLITLVIIASAGTFAASQLQRLAVDTSLSGWHKNEPGYQTALRLQKTNGKPIALFFHTDWCASCKQLTANVLGQKDVGEYLQGFNAVKINPENSSAERRLAKQYNILGFPSFLIKNPNSSTVVRLPVSSRTEPQQFVQWCSNATAQSPRKL